MAVQTVLAFVSLVLITTVISELSFHEENFKVETSQNDDDDGSGLRATDPVIADRTIINEDNVGVELIRNVGPLVPVGIGEESVSVDSSTFLYKGTEDTSIFPSTEEWTAQDLEGFSDSPSPKNNNTFNASLEEAATDEPPYENLKEIESEDLPSHIIEKGGRKYLDISSVNMTELKLLNLSDVYGISAENGQHCRIKKLIIAENHHVDRNIIKCHTLRNLTLLGNDWICGLDWSWLKELKDHGIALHAEAKCVDLKMPMPKGYAFESLNFTEGIAILQGLGIKDCPEKCKRCLTVLTKEKIFADYRVRCDRSNLTDEDIPSIPTYATQLSLESNQFQSTQKLFSHLKHLENINAILLGGNKLDAIPFLKENAFKKLNRLFLGDNNIRKVDEKAFESIVDREDIVVELQGNHFPCDCSSHFLLKLCLRNVTKVNNLIKKPLRCVNQTNNVRQLLTLRDECEPQTSDPNDLMPILLLFLGVMNVIFIYLVYDLVMAIRECRGQGSQIRDPKFHHLVMGTQRFIKCVFKKNEKNRREEVQERSSDVAGFRSHDTPVTLRTNRLSSVDRDSSMVRTDRRRLTPCPN